MSQEGCRILNNLIFIFYFIYYEIPFRDKFIYLFIILRIDFADELVIRLRTICYKYNDLSLVLYGDLNMDRDQFKNKVEMPLAEMGYLSHYNKGCSAYTRYEVRLGAPVTSYIDFMITYGEKIKEFSVSKPIGRSDHLTLAVSVQKDVWLKKMSQKKVLRTNFSKVAQDCEEVTKLMEQVLRSDDIVGKYKRLVEDLEHRYKPSVIKKNTPSRLKKAY